ncbi:hypothetical protein [Flavobacterium sp. ov086]|uniref:hypothetical protein n=1 Tax=Flavobacterium sp. ov086 TaxID=1761785 RepID=UPI000B6ED0A8|nr:hypothetical protein [Flavobacterium sp. ov086]SNR57451.1 hypothetical protein SAMN04487979_1128 [Flavobacterium sp. ov086]
MNQEMLFMSDQHFGQTNIMPFKERPFATIKEMDLELMKQRNEKVNSGNTGII